MSFLVRQSSSSLFHLFVHVYFVFCISTLVLETRNGCTPPIATLQIVTARSTHVHTRDTPASFVAPSLRSQKKISPSQSSCRVSVCAIFFPSPSSLHVKLSKINCENSNICTSNFRHRKKLIRITGHLLGKKKIPNTRFLWHEYKHFLKNTIQYIIIE